MYGILNYDTRKLSFIEETYKIARPEEVQEGKAQLLTTINSEVPEFTDVTISDITKNGSFSVTFENDMNVAQGMSGSVVLQNDKIIGIISLGHTGLDFLVADTPELMLREYLNFSRNMWNN